MYRTDEKLPLYRWNIFENFSAAINTGITTRTGGISKSPCNSLNLALHTGDSDVDVISNRKKLCVSINCDFQSYTCAEQTHGANIKLVTSHIAGSGKEEYSSSIADVDALVVKEKNIMVNIHVADCVPIVIYDHLKNVGALVHGGWKGTAKLLTKKTIRFMIEELDCSTDNMILGIGPSIGLCCYEIGRGTADKISGSFNYSDKVIMCNNGTIKADLKQENFEQALHSGISFNNIETTTICTACNNKTFFSYRGDSGNTGRFSAFLSLK